MNERIKELAVQADFMLCEDGHFYSEGQSQKTTDGLQKFAELIVQECQTVVEWAISVDSTIDRVPVLIKEHFGVEE
jgi:hypothetical protein